MNDIEMPKQTDYFITDMQTVLVEESFQIHATEKRDHSSAGEYCLGKDR